MYLLCGPRQHFFQCGPECQRVGHPCSRVPWLSHHPRQALFPTRYGLLSIWAVCQGRELTRCDGTLGSSRHLATAAPPLDMSCSSLGGTCAVSHTHRTLPSRHGLVFFVVIFWLVCVLDLSRSGCSHLYCCTEGPSSLAVRQSGPLEPVPAARGAVRGCGCGSPGSLSGGPCLGWGAKS